MFVRVFRVCGPDSVVVASRYGTRDVVVVVVVVVGWLFTSLLIWSLDRPLIATASLTDNKNVWAFFATGN